MTTEEALDFLGRWKPLPDEREISQELLDQLWEVVEHFKRVQDARCVQAFLLAMGDGLGTGGYDMIVHIITQYPDEVLRPAVEVALQSTHSGTRAWAINVSIFVADRSMIEVYRRALNSTDFVERLSAACALEHMATRDDRPWINDCLTEEREADVREQLETVLVALT